MKWLVDLDTALLRLFNLELTHPAQRDDEHHEEPCNRF